MIIFSKPGEKDKLKLFSMITLELIKNKKNVINLSFNYSEKYLYKQYGVTSLKVNKFKIKELKKINFSEKELEKMIRFEKETRENFNKKQWLDLAKKYIDFLERIREKENLEYALMWNTSCFFDRILYFFCKKYKIKYFVMEQGYFRPFTLSLDSVGVNFEANIPRSREAYENIQVNYPKYIEYLNKPMFAKNSEIQESKNKIYNFLRFYEKLKINFNKNYIWDITERDLFEFFKKRRKIKELKKKSSFKSIEGKYIFIPFQVEKDSQIILNSKQIKKMSELYEVVAKAIIKLNENKSEKIKAVFKLHPMDECLNVNEILKLEKKYSDTIFLMDGNIQELIKKSEMIITINSTVGIEALINNKPVITLGDAFYNIEGIADHCDNLERLSDIVKKSLLKNQKKELIDKFLYYLRFEYFEEVYWRNADEESIKKIVNKILIKGEKCENSINNR